MSRIYLGKLSKHDPLHGYLQHGIHPQINDASSSSEYRVFGLNGSNDVYLYEDRNTGTKVIGKFFLSSRKKDAAKAASRLTREFDNLCMVRANSRPYVAENYGIGATRRNDRACADRVRLKLL